MDFKIGSKYRGKNSKGEEIVIEIARTYGAIVYFNPISGDCDGATAFRNGGAMSNGLELVPGRPRICEVLGVEVGERFGIEGYGSPFTPFHINGDGKIATNNGAILSSELYDIINKKRKIIRAPQFSEDEKALMRLCVNEGYSYFIRRHDGEICVTKSIGEYGKLFPGFLLKQINETNSVFNAAEYLEAQK